MLQQHWFRYRNTLNTVKLDPKKYDCNIDDVVQLENICDDIESTLLTGKIFEVCIILVYFDITCNVDVRNVNVLRIIVCTKN